MCPEKEREKEGLAREMREEMREEERKTRLLASFASVYPCKEVYRARVKDREREDL